MTDSIYNNSCPHCKALEYNCVCDKEAKSIRGTNPMSKASNSPVSKQTIAEVKINQRQVPFVELLFGSFNNDAILISWPDICARNYDTPVTPKWFLDIFTELTDLDLPYDTHVCFRKV